MKNRLKKSNRKEVEENSILGFLKIKSSLSVLQKFRNWKEEFLSNDSFWSFAERFIAFSMEMDITKLVYSYMKNWTLSKICLCLFIFSHLQGPFIVKFSQNSLLQVSPQFNPSRSSFFTEKFSFTFFKTHLKFHYYP